MITSTDVWRERIAGWVPEDAIPSHRRDFGERYPWRTLALYSRTREHRQRVDMALRMIDDLPDLPDHWTAPYWPMLDAYEAAHPDAMPLSRGWYLALSGGKDSVAVAILLAKAGRRMPAMCALRTSVDFPAKGEYVEALCRHLGHEPHLLHPRRGVDAVPELVEMGMSLADDPGRLGRAMVEAGTWGNVEDWIARHSPLGVLLGLRAGESRGRKMNRRMRGKVYTRADGMTVCQPIADWTAKDVHALALANDVPILPLYLCVDPESDGMMLREDSILSGGWAAQLGAYAWLRRWWPEQWRRLVVADEAVATLG